MIKILAIKKRSALRKILTLNINQWAVTVDVNGKVQKITIYDSFGDSNKTFSMYVRQKILFGNQFHRELSIFNLVGKDVEEA